MQGTAERSQLSPPRKSSFHVTTTPFPVGHLLDGNDESACENLWGIMHLGAGTRAKSRWRVDTSVCRFTILAVFAVDRGSKQTNGSIRVIQDHRLLSPLHCLGSRKDWR